MSQRSLRLLIADNPGSRCRRTKHNGHRLRVSASKYPLSLLQGNYVGNSIPVVDEMAVTRVRRRAGCGAGEASKLAISRNSVRA